MGIIGVIIFAVAPSIVFGGIGGGLIGGGSSLAVSAIAAKKLPDELVSVDAYHLYLNKHSIPLVEIAEVNVNRKNLVVKTRNGKNYVQVLIQDPHGCCELIRQSISVAY